MKNKNTAFVAKTLAMMFALGFACSGVSLILLDASSAFGAGNAGVGTLSAMQYAASIVATLTFGSLTDKVSKRRILCIFGAVLAAGAVIGAFSLSFVMTAAAIFVFGIGFALVNGTSGAALSETDPAKSNMFTNYSQISYGVGAIVSPLIISALMNDGMDWRGSFALSAALLAVMVALMLLGKDPVLPAPAAPAEAGAKKGQLKQVLCPRLILLMLSLGMYVAMEMGVITFVKPYFVSEIASPANAALAMSLIWLAMIPSRLVAGRIHKRKGLIVCICFPLAALACLLFALVRVPGAALIWSALFGLAAGPIFPTIMSITIDSFRSHSGLVANLLMFAAGVFGMSSMLVMGSLSAAVGTGNAFFLVAVFASMGVVFFAPANARRQKEAGISD